jgi:hypothetical protein
MKSMMNQNTSVTNRTRRENASPARWTRHMTAQNSMSSRVRMGLFALTLTLSLASLFGANVTFAGIFSSSIGSICEDCDNKWYPGAVCKQAGTSQQLDYWFGRARNLSGAAKIADCPLIRDAARPYWVEINTIDRHWWDKVTCTLFTLRNDSANPNYYFQNGALNNSAGPFGTAGQADSVQTLKIYANGPKANTSYLVGCRLPPVVSGRASEIVSIRMGED